MKTHPHKGIQLILVIPHHAELIRNVDQSESLRLVHVYVNLLERHLIVDQNVFRIPSAPKIWLVSIKSVKIHVQDYAVPMLIAVSLVIPQCVHVPSAMSAIHLISACCSKQIQSPNNPLLVCLAHAVQTLNVENKTVPVPVNAYQNTLEIPMKVVVPNVY